MSLSEPEPDVVPETGALSKRLFVHKFCTESHHYLYAVHSNRVFRVSWLVYELADRPELDSPAAVCRVFPGLDEGEAELALEELHNAVRDGELSSKRPTGFAFRPGNALCDDLEGAKFQQLILNVTENCNLRCDYCIYSGNYEDQRTHGNRNMDFELAQKSLDLFMENANDSVYISFYGGEPLTRFGLIGQVIAYTETNYPHKLVKWSMTTNAVLVTPGIARFLMEKKVLLTVSLDGPREVNDRHRKGFDGQGAFDRVMRALQLLRDADPEQYDSSVQFSIVCAPPFDFSETERFFNTSELIRGHHYSFSYMNASTGNSALLPEEQHLEQLNAERSASRGAFVESLMNSDDSKREPFAKNLYEQDFIDFYNRSKTVLGDLIYPNGCCIPGAQRLFVSVDGNFHICEKLDNAYLIGNIENGLDRKRIEDFFEQYVALSRNCMDCWACRLCSLCFFNFISQGAFSAEHRSQECDALKSRWDRVLRDYYHIFEADEHALDHLAKTS